MRGRGGGDRGPGARVVAARWEEGGADGTRTPVIGVGGVDRVSLIESKVSFIL